MKDKRDLVREVSLDLSLSMNLIASTCFTHGSRVADRFHVQRLACDAVQEKCIKYRWAAIVEESKAYKKAKEADKKYEHKILPNKDTKKQLLARSRYLLFKHKSKWTEKQKIRANILFELYPDLQTAYNLSSSLFEIYERKYQRGTGLLKLAHWVKDVQESGFDSFGSISRTFRTYYDIIANYFTHRSTNAAAESFNAKIKEFRRQFRGVTDYKFFLYRLTKIFA